MFAVVSRQKRFRQTNLAMMNRLHTIANKTLLAFSIHCLLVRRFFLSTKKKTTFLIATANLPLGSCSLFCFYCFRLFVSISAATNNGLRRIRWAHCTHTHTLNNKKFTSCLITYYTASRWYRCALTHRIYWISDKCCRNNRYGLVSVRSKKITNWLTRMNNLRINFARANGSNTKNNLL